MTIRRADLSRCDVNGFEITPLLHRHRALPGQFQSGDEGPSPSAVAGRGGAHRWRPWPHRAAAPRAARRPVSRSGAVGCARGLAPPYAAPAGRAGRPSPCRAAPHRQTASGWPRGIRSRRSPARPTPRTARAARVRTRRDRVAGAAPTRSERLHRLQRDETAAELLRYLALFTQKAGAASALVGAIHFSAGMLSAAMVGWLADGTPWTMGWIIGVSGVGSFVTAMLRRS
jgi:hypothetical protein